VIGYAILVWVWTNEFGADILWVDEVVVDQFHRGKGIGKKFFAWLQKVYGDSPAFSLLVSERNHKAKRLYQDIGFKEIQTQMLKVNNVLKMNVIVEDSRELIQAV
jgi:GNAT superfamily N-acetyltransferase